MFDSPLIQIALSVTLVFILFSLLVSGVQEMFVAILHSRGVALWDGIETLFGGGAEGKAAREKLVGHPLIRTLVPPSSWSKHKPTVGRRSTPSYIPAQIFARTVLDLLRRPHESLARMEEELRAALVDLRTGQPLSAGAQASIASLVASVQDTSLANPLAELQTALANGAHQDQVAAVERVLGVLPVRWKAAMVGTAKELSSEFGEAIETLTSTTAGGIEEFRHAIEEWFDHAMAGLSGWYKRWTMAVQFGIGFVLALAMNVDTVHIVRALSKDVPLRQALARQADEFARSGALPMRTVEGKLDEATGALTGVSVRSSRPERFDLVVPAAVAPGDVGVEIPASARELITCAPAASQEPQPAGEENAISCRVNAADVARPQQIQLTLTSQRQEGETQSQATVTVFLVPSAAREYERLQDALDGSGLPIGWSDGGLYPDQKVGWYIPTLLGWLLTAFAASLGAPFWFDLLSKVAHLRAAGKSPSETAPEPRVQ